MRIVLAGFLTAAAATNSSSLQSQLQEMLNQLASGSVGLQLGWKSAGESFTIAAGTVTNPGERSRPITPEDTFNYGSGTKATIAAAVMRMADEGKLKLSDKVTTYINPFLKRNNGTTLEELYGSQISEATVLQVLRMEAGIPDFEDRGGIDVDNQALYSDGQVFPPYAWMRAVRSPKCSPGACSYYSSTSYEVAGLLIAAIQKPDGDWYDLDFQKAIGGASRYPSMTLPGSQGKLKDTISVSGHTRQGVTLWDQNPSIMGWSCGGLNANTGDLAHFFYDLLDDSSPNPLVSKAALKEMTNLKPLTTGYFRVDYGAGLMDSAAPKYNQPTSKGADDWSYIIGHIGETFAYHAISGYLPKAKAAISIVTNSDSGFSSVSTAACKASVIAAQVLGGETVNLGCSGSGPGPSPSPWGRRRRRPQQTSSEAEDIIV